MAVSMEMNLTRFRRVVTKIRALNREFEKKRPIAGALVLTSDFVALPSVDHMDIANSLIAQQERVYLAGGPNRHFIRDGVFISRRDPRWRWDRCEILSNAQSLARRGAFVIFSRGVSEMPGRTSALSTLVALASLDHHDQGESFFYCEEGKPYLRLQTVWFRKMAVGPFNRYASRANRICGIWASLPDE